VEQSVKLNEQIRYPKVRLVLTDNKMFGEVPVHVALSMAREQGLDLVEVNSGSPENLPVCKILDYGKQKYHEEKNKRKNAHAGNIVFKEIWFKFTTQEHDLVVKHAKILEFLKKKYHVKYGMELIGRLKEHVEEAKDIFIKTLETFNGIASWQEPTVSGGESRTVTIMTVLEPV